MKNEKITWRRKSAGNFTFNEKKDIKNLFKLFKNTFVNNGQSVHIFLLLYTKLPLKGLLRAYSQNIEKDQVTL